MKEVKINCSLSNTLVSTESHLVQCTCKEDTIPTITRDLIANLPLFHTIIRTQPVQKTSLDDFRRRMAPLYPAMRFVKDTCLCKCRIAVLNSINNTELPDRYARLPAFLNEMSSLNEYLSTVLQAAEGSNEFFRYFHAFPIARHHGLLTQAISVIDCCHWKCNSYDGVMLFLVSKTGFGKTILLAVAILPVEDAASIAWFIQNCWRHGMTLEFPIFTDQGPMLAAARAIYKKFRVLFFLVLCLQHIIRRIRANFPSLFGKGKLAKQVDSIVRSSVNEAHYAPTQLHFFDTIQNMVLSLISIRPDEKSVCIDVGLYLLALRPGLWTVFGNTPAFDNKRFELQHKQIVSNLFAAKSFIVLSSKVLNTTTGTLTVQDLLTTFTTCIQRGLEACSTFKFKTADFKDSACALMGCSRTNIVESFNFVTKSTGARYQDPPVFISMSFEIYNKQVDLLLADLTCCMGVPLTTIGTKIKMQTSLSANINSTNDLPSSNQFQFFSPDGECPGTLSATFSNDDCSTYLSSVSWQYDSKKQLIFSHYCEKHVVLSSQYRCPCLCVYHICTVASKCKEKGKEFCSWPVELANFGQDVDTITRYLFPQCLLASYNYNFLQDNNATEFNKIKLKIPSLNHCTNATPIFGISPSGCKVRCTTLLPPRKYKERLNNVRRIRSNGEGFGSPPSSPSKRRRLKNEGGEFANSQTKMVGMQKPSRFVSKALVAINEDPSESPIVFSSAALNEITVADDKHKSTYCNEKKCTTCGETGHNYPQCPKSYSQNEEITAARHILPGPYFVYRFGNKPAILGPGCTYNPLLPPVELQALSKLSKEDDPAFFDPMIAQCTDGEPDRNEQSDVFDELSDAVGANSVSRTKVKTIHTDRLPTRDTSFATASDSLEDDNTRTETSMTIYGKADTEYGVTLNNAIYDGGLFRTMAPVSQPISPQMNPVLKAVVQLSVSSLDSEYRTEFDNQLPNDDCSIYYSEEVTIHSLSQESNSEYENLEKGIPTFTQTQELLDDSSVFSDVETVIGVSGNTNELLSQITDTTPLIVENPVYYSLLVYYGNGTSGFTSPVDKVSLDTLDPKENVGGECIDVVSHLLCKTKRGDSKFKGHHLQHILYQTSFVHLLLSRGPGPESNCKSRSLTVNPNLRFVYDNVSDYRRDCNIFECRSLYIPICHQQIHWILCEVRMKDKCLLFYDSCIQGDSNGRFEQIHSTYAPAILYFIGERSKTIYRPFHINTWKVFAQPFPQQSCVSNDCGVFVILALIQLVCGKSFNFSQNTIDDKKTRQHLRNAIMYQRLDHVDLQGRISKKYTKWLPQQRTLINISFQQSIASYLSLLPQFNSSKSTLAGCQVTSNFEPRFGLNPKNKSAKYERKWDSKSGKFSTTRQKLFCRDKSKVAKVSSPPSKLLVIQCKKKCQSANLPTPRRSKSLLPNIESVNSNSTTVPAHSDDIDVSSGDECLKAGYTFPRSKGPHTPLNILLSKQSDERKIRRERFRSWKTKRNIDLPQLFTTSESHSALYDIDKKLQYLNIMRQSVIYNDKQRYVFPLKSTLISKIRLEYLADNEPFINPPSTQIIDMATQWMLMQTSDTKSNSKLWYPLTANIYNQMTKCKTSKNTDNLLGIRCNLFDCNVLDIVIYCKKTYSIMFILNLNTCNQKPKDRTKKDSDPFPCIIHYYQDSQSSSYSPTCARVVRTFLTKLAKLLPVVDRPPVFNINNLPLYSILGKYLLVSCNVFT